MVAKLLSLLLAAQPTLAEQLAGCTKTPLNAGSQFTCGSLLAGVMEYPLAPPVAVSTLYQGITATVDGVVSSTDEDFTVEGKSGLMRRFEVRKPPANDASFTGRVAAIDVGNGASWVFFCGYFSSADLRQATTRCDALIAGFSKGGPAPFRTAATSPREARFGGRKLSVPEGCSVKLVNEKAAQIGCSDAELTAGTVPPGVEVAKASDVAMQSVLAVAAGAKEVEARKCLLDGTETTCRVAASPASLIVLAVRGLPGGGAVVVTCEQPRGMKKPHPVCSNLLSF